MDKENGLPDLPPEEELLELLPAEPTTIEGVAVPSRSEFAEAVVRRSRRALGETLRRQRREAPGIAEELLAQPDLEARRAIRRSRGRMYSAPLVEVLTRRGGETALVDANEGLRILALAEAVLGGIPRKVAGHFRPRYLLDLQAGLEAEKGNALRILRRWREARIAFRRAFALVDAGSHDLLLIARIAYLAGSHYWWRGRLRAAATALSLAAQLYGELGEENRLGETQLKQAALLDTRGLLPEAVKAQTEALGNLDEDANPLTTLAAYTNLAELLRRTGDPRSALDILVDAQYLTEALGGSRAHGVWHWIRGRCRIDSGTLEGESDLRAAWRILEPTGDTYSLGLIGCDLCKFYLGRCNLEQLEHWVGPMVRALEPHAPSPLVARELGQLGESVQTLKLNAARVSQVLELVSKTMDPRRGSQEARRR